MSVYIVPILCMVFSVSISLNIVWLTDILVNWYIERQCAKALLAPKPSVGGEE